MGPDFFRKAGPMGVKVVSFILFALVGECLSLTEHEEQVNDVLFKMSDKLTGIDEKLSSIEERVHVLENSQTKSKENKPTNLEDAMRNLKNLKSGSPFRSLGQGIPGTCPKEYKVSMSGAVRKIHKNIAGVYVKGSGIIRKNPYWVREGVHLAVTEGHWSLTEKSHLYARSVDPALAPCPTGLEWQYSTKTTGDIYWNGVPAGEELKVEPYNLGGKTCDSSPTDTGIVEVSGKKPYIIGYCPANPLPSVQPEKSGNYVEIMGEKDKTMDQTTSLLINGAFTKICDETEDINKYCSCKALLEPLLTKLDANVPRITNIWLVFAAGADKPEEEKKEIAIAGCRCYLGRAIAVSADFKYIQVKKVDVHIRKPTPIKESDPGGEAGYVKTCLDIIQNCDYEYKLWYIRKDK